MNEYSNWYNNPNMSETGEMGDSKVAVTTLPSELPPLIISIPSGRFTTLPPFLSEVMTQAAEEGYDHNAMVMITDNGNTPSQEIAKNFSTLDGIAAQLDIPIYIQTGETKQEAYKQIVSRFPQKLQDDPLAMEVAKKLLTSGGYGPQRTRLETYVSTNGFTSNELSQPVNRITLSLDDDLRTNQGQVPYLTEGYANAHNIPIEENGAAFIPRGDFQQEGTVRWQKQDIFDPYRQVLGKTATPLNIPVYQEGRNDQNPALEATQGGKIITTFKEHGADNSPQITDPNARFLMAFAKKWGNPDVEAYSKLVADVQAGKESPELNVMAIPTGESKTIGVLTHPVNMDTAHTAKDWSQTPADLLAFLITDPEISDKYGTMSLFDTQGKSKTNGVRAEMCLLIGPDGLLKQISDAFQNYHVAAQVSTVFEHKRMPTLRAPEAVATFSEFLGMELAAVVRENMRINPEDHSISLRDITHNPTILPDDIVHTMYDKMQAVIGEIDTSIGRLAGQNDEVSNKLRADLQKTKLDIFNRLQNGSGLPDFKIAVNQELREQYRYMMKVFEVDSAIKKAGADLRREGQYPVAQYIPTK